LGNSNNTLFGLGNSTYEFYNGAAVKAQKALQTATATIPGEFGMGDDGAGTLHRDYLVWKEAILDILKSSLSLTESDTAFEPTLKLNGLHPGNLIRMQYSLVNQISRTWIRLLTCPWGILTMLTHIWLKSLTKRSCSTQRIDLVFMLSLISRTLTCVTPLVTTGLSGRLIPMKSWKSS
jgi:hypothetical protein